MERERVWYSHILVTTVTRICFVYLIRLNTFPPSLSEPRSEYRPLPGPPVLSSMAGMTQHTFIPPLCSYIEYMQRKPNHRTPSLRSSPRLSGKRLRIWGCVIYSLVSCQLLLTFCRENFLKYLLKPTLRQNRRRSISGVLTLIPTENLMRKQALFW